MACKVEKVVGELFGVTILAPMTFTLASTKRMSPQKRLAKPGTQADCSVLRAVNPKGHAFLLDDILLQAAYRVSDSMHYLHQLLGKEKMEAFLCAAPVSRLNTPPPALAKPVLHYKYRAGIPSSAGVGRAFSQWERKMVE